MRFRQHAAPQRYCSWLHSRPVDMCVAHAILPRVSGPPSGACVRRAKSRRKFYIIANAALQCSNRYGDDLDVSVNIAAVADYLEDCARAQAAKPASPLPDYSLPHLVCAVCPTPYTPSSSVTHRTGLERLTRAGLRIRDAQRCCVMLAALHPHMCSRSAI